MKSLRLALAVLGMGCVFGGSAVQATDSVTAEGYWLTENKRSVIRIVPCADDAAKLCGHIHWVIPGGLEFDIKNPDETKRSRSTCGLPILTDFKKQSATMWGDGKIYKADDGDIYNATMQLLPNGNLIVRGYVGMPLFGKSQTWTRVSTTEYQACKK